MIFAGGNAGLTGRRTKVSTPCAHCGLPVVGRGKPGDGPAFCCYGCYLVHRIVGGGSEEEARTIHTWMLLRLAIGALLAMNVMMLALLLYTGQTEPQAEHFFRWVMFALATPAMGLLVYPFALGAVAEFRRRRLSLDTLIAIGALTAYGVSAYDTIRGYGPVYFDTATMLPVLVTFGKLIEATAKSRTQKVVRLLETLLPRTATRIDETGPSDVPLAELKPGDRVLVRPGERIPVDGRVLEGSTEIDQASFTGESQPRLVGPGDEVLAGTVCGRVQQRRRPSEADPRSSFAAAKGGAGQDRQSDTQPLLVIATATGEKLLLRRIVALVEQARATASDTERLAERAATIFVPIVLLISAIVAVGWLATGQPAAAGFAALAVLVVACPCAMGIAAPLATSLAIGRAAAEGVVVRGGDVMELAGKIETVYFDKTGTLTLNEPRLARIEMCATFSQRGNRSENDVLADLAALEAASEHSLARAVLAEARSRGLPVRNARDVRIVPGQGIIGCIDCNGIERKIRAGSDTFVASPPPAGEALDSSMPNERGSNIVVDVAYDGELCGRLIFEQQPRPDAASAVAQLRQLGIGSILLSGDRASSAQAVARPIGIERVLAPCLPNEKIAHVESARHAGRTVAMVGDGINDAPALAAADIGVAVNGPVELVRESGNVALMSDRLTLLPWLVRLSRRTRRIIVQNLLWALGYNMAAIAAAAAGLLHPLLAALAMVVSSLTVLSNSLRLQRFPSGHASSST